MSKRRREEENDGDPGDQRECALDPGRDDLSLPPLQSDMMPLDLVRSLSPSDLSVDLVLSPRTLPSPKFMPFADPVDSCALNEQFEFCMETTSSDNDNQGPSFNPENVDQTPVATAEHLVQPSHVARPGDFGSQVSTTQMPSTSGDTFFSPHVDVDHVPHSELHLDPDQISEQPLNSNQTTLSIDDPVGIVEAFDSNEHLEPGYELPLFDAFDSFGGSQYFFQEEETHFPPNQGEEDADLCGTLGFETESFFDALDSEPLPEGDRPKSDPPLYDGASISVTEATTALLTFMLGCKISGQVMEQLISLINLLLPSGHRLVTSIFSFHKYFEHIKTPINLIYHCTICFQRLEAKDSLCDKCKNETKVGFYIHVPIIDQLRSLYARPGFVDLLSYRHRRVKKVPQNIEDIYDGTFYKCLEGSLGPLDITLMWNTDGLSLYKSSSYQIWPIYFTINELPPELRHKEENLILGGIAIGYEKPRPNLLLKSLYEECKCLEKGVDVIVHGKDNPDQVKCFLMCGTADAPAKAMILKMTQFNGHHGCHCCYIKGEKSDRTDQVFVYPFEERLLPRSKEAYQDDLKNLSNGVKGPTYLFYMVCNFFMLSTAIDCMHNIYLGICRQIFTIWFSSDYFKLVFGDKAEKKTLLDLLSTIFCSFQPPHYFDRPPRSLNHVNYFKASEFRTWLHSTALPVFEKHMKEPYFNHFKKLVFGVTLLNQASVSLSDIQLARTVFISFVEQFQELYGFRNMSYNVHCLLHLVDTVLSLGPLWVSSCFKFENVNGILARLVHGTRYAGCQIQSNLGLLKKIPSLINSLQNNSAKSFCATVMSYRKKLAVTLKISSKTFVIGKMINTHVFSDPKYFEVLNQIFSGNQMHFFFRLKKDGFLYVSEEYERGLRDSSNVHCKFSNGTEMFGSVKIFVRISSCECSNTCSDHPAMYFALIQRYTFSYPFVVDFPEHQAATISSIVKFEPIDEYVAVEISNLNSVCFKMCVGTSKFLSVPVNYQEME